MRKSFWALAAVGVLAVAGFASTALADHSWGSYHWAREGSTFTLKVGDNVDSRWDAYLDEAIADWTQSSVIDLTKVAGGTRPRNCKATTGRIEACNASYGNTGWLGLAQIWVSGSHITKAITKVNDTYFDTDTYNKPEWRRLVMCQEIAHDFGLDHQDENFDNPNLGSCMDYTSNPLGPPSNEHPNAHDFEQIETIYSHLDSTTTVSSSTREKAGPMQRVRDDLWVQELGNGRRLYTHVFWADPHRMHGPPDVG